MHFGDDFAELVLESDSKTKKPPSDPNQAALVKAVFDHLDSDERNEFRAVKENVDKEEKAKKQLKWRKLLKEKLEEQRATWAKMGTCHVCWSGSVAPFPKQFCIFDLVHL